MSDIILYRTHEKSQLECMNFKELLHSNCFNMSVLYDATDKEALPGVINYTFEDILNSGLVLADNEQLNTACNWKEFHKKFPKDKSKQLWYNCGHLPIMYYLENPNYDYYWSIEYDVYFYGDWNFFFDKFKNVTDDFLGMYIRDYKYTTNDLYWSYFKDKNDYTERLASFGPVQRYSNKLLATVASELKKGNHAYYEILFPSVAKEFNMTIKEINDIYNFYDIFTMNDEPLNLFKIVHLPHSKNKLFHPVK